MRSAPMGNPKFAVLACALAHRAGRRALLCKGIVEPDWSDWYACHEDHAWSVVLQIRVSEANGPYPPHTTACHMDRKKAQTF